ncbi:hypothetical protein D7X74_01475 [Corallococcus sp. CA047B]|uniref:hypothetical protein n=1 Tax=Corallococcus sp. CA047B TaxID=2316729 RepID=UPI000EA25E32|nr:hypothetical protein [Corallococcus sp. CA047B]RKH21378.1 hypothetical protein D7X74_01475 [Corallococcus sp. CA047B]
MIYGGSNDILDPNSAASRIRFPSNGAARSPYNGKCPACDKSCDTHKPFPFVSSDDFTEKLAKKLQGLLDAARVRGLLKGFELSKGACMVGAARATINSKVYTWVTISGGITDMLGQFDNTLGKDVQIVKTASALPLRNIKGTAVTGTPVAWNRNRDYPAGACAAQKLLMEVFNQAKGTPGKISKLTLAEILWSDPAGNGHNRDWSTGQLVESCDTCKQLIPMMLCSGG